MDKKYEYEIPIEGKKIIGKPKTIIIDKIEFDEFNPRISMSRDSEVLGTGNEKISQKLIGLFIKTQSSYSDLKNAIRHSRGATVPIWVYPIGKGKFKVIEGNTRLKVHQDLQIEDEDITYSKINCIVLPHKLEDEVKDYIRLICHLRGQTEWDKYEQAKYLHMLYHNDKYPVKSLIKITKLTKSEILQDIEAYEIMANQFSKKYGESEIVHKYSYFKEYVKNKKLRQTMENLNYTDSDFCDWVGQKKIGRAMDVRKLKSILDESEAKKIFLKKDLERSLDKLKFLVPEKSEKFYILLNDIRKKIDKLTFGEIQELKNKNSKKRKILEKLHQKLSHLLGIK